MIPFYISLSTYICFCILKFRRSIMALEDSNYNLKKYLGSNSLVNLELCLIILIIIVMNADILVSGICTVIFYCTLFLFELRNKKGKFNLNLKNILIICFILIFYVLMFILFNFFGDTALYYLIIILMGYLSYFAVGIAYLFSIPFIKIRRKFNA